MFRKRIIALSFVFVICFSCIAPFAYADDYQSSIVGLWDSFFAYGSKVSEDVPVLGDIMQGITSIFVGAICPTSDDRYHHTNSIVGCETGKDNHGYYAVATCSYCGQHFKCYSSDLSAAYDNYVQDIQVESGTTVFGENGVYFYSSLDLSHSRFSCYSHTGSSLSGQSVSGSISSIADGFSFSGSSQYLTTSPLLVVSVGLQFPEICSSGQLGSGFVSLHFPDLNFLSLISSNVVRSDSFLFPNGHSVSQFTGFGTTLLNFGGSNILFSSPLTGELNVTEYCLVGWGVNPSFSSSYVSFQLDPVSNVFSGSVVCKSLPYIYFVPDSFVPKDINSRSSNIFGNYGIIGDNGQITKVEGNTIVNEGDKTVYNPVTNTTTNITDWTYDYSDRSYTVITDSGNTQTITYGDEYVTIKEGDTVYNIYYIVEGSGSGTDTPAR